MQNTEADIQIIKSGHETKREIQQKSGVSNDKTVNNKQLGFSGTKIYLLSQSLLSSDGLQTISIIKRKNKGRVCQIK